MGCVLLMDHPFLSSLLETSIASSVNQLCQQNMGADQGHCQVNKASITNKAILRNIEKVVVDK